MTTQPAPEPVRRPATLAESGAMVLDEELRSVWEGGSFAAPAFTVLSGDGDNLAIHSGVASAPRGSVLAIGIEGHTQAGLLG